MTSSYKEEGFYSPITNITADIRGPLSSIEKEGRWLFLVFINSLGNIERRETLCNY
jgi:hypothetical protein